MSFLSVLLSYISRLFKSCVLGLHSFLRLDFCGSSVVFRVKRLEHEGLYCQLTLAQAGSRVSLPA